MELSIMDEIQKIIESKEKYIYQRIINYIGQYNYDYSNEYKNHLNNIETSLLEEFKKILIAFMDKNNIKITIDKNEKNTMKEIEKYFIDIIKLLDEKEEHLKLVHVKILKNLLISEKGKKALKPNKNLNKKIFSINDFIENYSKIAIIKLFKEEEFKQKDSDDLKNIYLYYIFQIKDTENLKKLKIYIYTYLYDHKNINEFINKSSEEIIQKGTGDEQKLRNFEIKYNELNINFKKASNEMISFFGKDLRKNNSDLLNFFIPEIIKRNYKYIEDENKAINEEQIALDSLEYDENKIHLFSSEFLIVNGLKSQLEENDFEIYNKGNYSVDLFAKFLRKIIKELNNCIKENNYKSDFIINHLFDLHKKNLSHYIRSKLDYNDKQVLNRSDNQIFDKNSFLKIKIYQKYDNENKNEINNQDNQNKGNNSIESNASLNLDLIDKSIKSTENSFSEFSKETSDYFENLINTTLIGNNKSNKLIALPNIALKFNLKIPVYDEDTNSIHFKSVHLDYSKEDGESKNANKYGFKEIDSVFQNISNNPVFVGDINYFNVNFKFIKRKNGEKFVLIEKDENIFNIYSDSIFFCEIKNAFPNTSRGKKEFLNKKILKLKKSNNVKINEQLGGLDPYIEELDKLLRKFFFFFDIYKKNNNNYIPINMQIVLLYDFFNVNKIDPDFKDIKEVTQKILNLYCKKFKLYSLGNIIFQLIFFDRHSLNKDREKIIKEQKLEIDSKNNQLKDKDDTIQKKEDELKAKDDTIQKQKNELKAKDDTIQKKEDELKAKDDTIQKKEDELKVKDKTIQVQQNELKDKDIKLLEQQQKEKNWKNKIEQLKKDDKLTDEQKWILFNNFLKKEGDSD